MSIVTLEVCTSMFKYLINQIILFLMGRSNFGNCYCQDFETLIDLLNRFINCLDKVQPENKNTVSHYFYESGGFENIMFSVTKYFIIDN